MNKEYEKLLKENADLREELEIQSYLIDLLKKDRRGELKENEIEKIRWHIMEAEKTDAMRDKKGSLDEKMECVINECAKNKSLAEEYPLLQKEAEFLKVLITELIFNNTSAVLAASKSNLQKFKNMFGGKTALKRAMSAYKNAPDANSLAHLENCMKGLGLGFNDQSAAWLELAHELKDNNKEACLQCARKAWMLNPNSHILKWIANRYDESGDVVKAYLFYHLAGSAGNLSESEMRKEKRLEKKFRQEAGKK